MLDQAIRYEAKAPKYAPGTICKGGEGEPCAKPAFARGWCRMHYMRWWSRGGDPTINRKINDAVLRLALQGRREGECLVWTRHVDRERGYGTTGYKGKLVKVHRLQWELVNGPIPEGMQVCHTCDNPPCYRLEHLFLGTHADNMKDMSAKGRAGVVPRDMQPGAKVSSAQVAEIVELYYRYHTSLRKLAAQYGVAVSTIGRIVKRGGQ